MNKSEELEQRIRQLELTALVQKSCIQVLHGVMIANAFAEGDAHAAAELNDHYHTTLMAFIRANFNKAKISQEDYDRFIDSSKTDDPSFPFDFSGN